MAHRLWRIGTTEDDSDFLVALLSQVPLRGIDWFWFLSPLSEAHSWAPSAKRGSRKLICVWYIHDVPDPVFISSRARAWSRRLLVWLPELPNVVQGRIASFVLGSPPGADEVLLGP
jgi:hypothetical protein